MAAGRLGVFRECVVLLAVVRVRQGTSAMTVDAVMSSGLALLHLGVVVLAAGALGGRIVQWLRISVEGVAEAAVLSISLGLGALAYGTLLLGILGWLYRPAGYALLLGAGVLGGARGLRVAFPRVRWTVATSTDRALWLVVGLAVALNLVGTLAPVSSSDALRLHVGVPKLWLQQHRMVELPADWESYHAFAVNALYLLGMLLHSDIVAALIHWLFGVLILAGIAVLCRRYFPDARAATAIAIFYVSGLLAWESTSTFADLGLTLFAVLAFAAVLRSLSDAAPSRWWRLAGVFAGLAAATKYQGAMVPVLLAGILVTPWVGPAGQVGRRLAAFGLPAALLAVPWYLRNYVYTGDPFYPLGAVVLGDPHAAMLLQWVSSASGHGMSWLDLLVAPFRMTFNGAAFGESQLLGPLYLTWLPVAAFMGRGATRAVRLAWLWCAGFTLIWFLTTQQIRYLLPVIPIAAVLVAQALGQVLRTARLPVVRFAAQGSLAAAVACGLAVTGVYNAALIPVVVGAESRDAFLARTTWFYDEIAWMNAHLPRDARVLFLERAGYYLDRDQVKRWEAEAPTLDVKAPEFPAWVEQQGITHIFCQGESCERLRGAGWPLQTLRETETQLLRSRTLGDSYGRTKTAVFFWRGPGLGR